jgi:hypothetical protein
MGPQGAYLLNGCSQPPNFLFQLRLMAGKRRLQFLPLGFKHARYLGQGKAEVAQGEDFGGPGHFLWSIAAPSRRCPDRPDHASLFIDTKCLLRHAETGGGLRRAKVKSGRRHESPRCLLPPSYGGSPKGKVNGGRRGLFL